MSKPTIAILASLLIAAPALAEKPEHAKKGKPSPEQVEAHREAAQSRADEEAGEYRHMAEEKRAEAQEAREEAQANRDEAAAAEAEAKDNAMKAREKREKKEMKKRKGLEKQKEKKADRVRKELDKGSEQGQAAREEHSKKWWQFWKD